MGGPILVIDDEPAVLRLLALVLDDFGYEVYAAPDAESALTALESMRPEVIVSDVKLPGIDGTEFVRRVRATEGISSIPVILVSAYDEPADHAADRFVRKPLDPMELADVVRDASQISVSR